MNDKDPNFYLNFPNPYLFYTMYYYKCSMCSNLYLAYPFQAFASCCQSCIVKYCSQTAAPKPVQVKRSLQEGEKFEVSDEIAGSLLFVCDFFYHFKHLLKINELGFDELVKSIKSTDLTQIFQEVCKTLTLKVVENVYRQDSDIKITEKSLILFMGFKLFEITDIRSELDVVWPALLGEIIHLKCYKDLIKGSVLEDLKQVLTSALTVDLLLAFSDEEKTAILEFLVNCFLDSKEFRESLAERVEYQVNLTKTKTEKKQRIKQIENEIMLSPTPLPHLESEKSSLHQEEESLKSQIDQVFYRTTSFGQDCEGNEYYFFDFDPSRIFVNHSKNPAGDSGTWRYFEHNDKLSKLLSDLQPEKSREKKLKSKIESLILTKLQKKPIEIINLSSPSSPLEPISSLDSVNGTNPVDLVDLVDSSETSDPSIPVKPLNPSTKPTSLEKHTVTLDQVKDFLKSIEKTFSKYLYSGKKRWNFEAEEKKWKISLSEAEDLTTLSDLVLDFAEKALNPLRFQKIPKQKMFKYRKVILKLWQNCQEGANAWEKFVKGCQSTEELMLALKVFEKIILAYIDKKKDDCIKHGDECFKCEDGGKLIMCETCPRVAHLKCVGLVKIPIGEWQCEVCLQDN